RLNPDGTLDPSFDASAQARNIVFCLALQPDGKILLGGSFSQINGQPLGGIARLNPDGTLDPDFYASVDSYPYVYCLALQLDGKILPTGDFIVVARPTPSYLPRRNPT